MTGSSTRRYATSFARCWQIPPSTDYPGAHHFYITFLTGHPGVDIPDHLRAQYPDTMTIVLEHQFWGLEVEDDRFSVTLSFSGVNQRLSIPFAAVTAFADPSVRFGLQFHAPDDVEGEDGTHDAVEEALVEAAGESDSAARADATDGDDAAKSPSPAPSDDDKVVTLDAFRRKN